MPTKGRAAPRRAMYDTPAIRNGGFGALQLEAVTNKPLSIARRHLAASQLRMSDIEPHELSSSEWLRFLAMEDRERERWKTQFRRKRSNSGESTSSADLDGETAYNKAEEARAEEREARRATVPAPTPPSQPRSLAQPVGSTPAVVQWARQFDSPNRGRETRYDARRPMHARRAVGEEEAPPNYSSVIRARTPPPSYAAPPNYETQSVYEARINDDGGASPTYSPPA